MPFTITIERTQRRWQADVRELPGTQATGPTPVAALEQAHLLARRAIEGDATITDVTRRKSLIVSLASAFTTVIAACTKPQE
jgi:hypothetical protein